MQPPMFEDALRDRPGWAAVAGLAADGAEHGHLDASKRRTLRARVSGGAVILECPDPPPATSGMIAAARAVSAETCDRCGGKGSPCGPPGGPPDACRCAGCRDAGHAPLPRAWTRAEKIPDMAGLSPGQRTQDLRGGATGNNPDIGDWRCYGRLEHRYSDEIAELMAGRDDTRAMRFWTGRPGWAGLIRALLIVMRPEQDERPEDAGHKPWRLRWMKEKWGRLDVRTTGDTAYQWGAVRYVETMSTLVCEACGMLGKLRYGRCWRVECEGCWGRARPEDVEEDARARPPDAADGGEPPPGCRGARVYLI